MIEKQKNQEAGLKNLDCTENTLNEAYDWVVKIGQDFLKEKNYQELANLINAVELAPYCVLPNKNWAENFNHFLENLKSKGVEFYSYFLKSIGLENESIDSYIILGLYSLRKGDYEKSLSILEEAKKLDPENSYVFTALGQYYLEQKDYENALVNLGKATELDTTNSYNFIILSAYYLEFLKSEELKRYSAEKKEYHKNIVINLEKARDLNSKSPYIYAYAIIGKCPINLQTKDGSSITENINYEKLQSLTDIFWLNDQLYLSINRCYDPSLYTLLCKYHYYDIFPLWYKVYDEWEFHDKYPYGYNGENSDEYKEHEDKKIYFNCFDRANHFIRTADEYSEKAISFGAKNADAYALQANCILSWCEKNHGSYENIKKLLDEAIKLEPDNAYAHAVLGLYNSKEKKIDEALSNLNKAIENRTKYLTAYYERASLLIELNKDNISEEDIAQCFDDCEKVSRYSSFSHREIYKPLLKNVAEKLGGFDKGVAHIEKLSTNNFNVICALSGFNRKNLLLEEKIKHLEEAQKRLRELVQNTSHLAGNLLRPNTQEKIAKKLKNSEFSEESKKLYYASSDIKYVKQQFKLLEIMQSLTGSEAITSQIKLDQVDKSNNQSMSIEDILNLAAFRAIDKLFDTNEYSLNFARETIEKNQGDFSKLSNEYQKYVLATNDDNYKLSIISWCSKNLRPITINYKCDDWKKILFYNNSQSVALFFCYFFELFFNAFKYADHNEYDFLTITLANEFIDDNEFLTMTWTNPKGNQVSFGSNKGLNLSASYISLLNDDKYKDKSQELIAHADNTFELITRIDRKIFNL